MHLLHMTHMSFKCIHPLYISRGFSGQWVNRFVLSCLAMALIGGPFPNIVLHPPEQFILQIIVNLKKSDFSSLSPPAELTIVQLHHRSAAWVSSELAALQILCYLALVLSPGPFIERWAFPRIEGPAPHFWETDWQRTAIRGGCKREGISEASLSQNWGASPSILGKGPSPKKRPI